MSGFIFIAFMGDLHPSLLCPIRPFVYGNRHPLVWSYPRDRQEITWTFECPIAPHLGSLLNRDIRDVEQLRLWFRSIGRDPIWGTLGPQIVQLISCRSLITCRRLAEIFVRAGEIYLAAGKTEKAEGLRIRAMKCSPGNTATMLKLASLYKTTGRLSETLAMYKALAAIEPAKSNISTLSVKVKQIADAEAAFSKAVASAPTGSSAYPTLARFYLEKQMNLPRARALAEKAVMLDPTGSQLHCLSGRAEINSQFRGNKLALDLVAPIERIHRRSYSTSRIS